MEVERLNLNNFAQRMPPELQQYYISRVNDLTAQIDASKKSATHNFAANMIPSDEID